VVAGPSGVGKGTLIGKLMEEMPGKFGFSVSHTTRAPRDGEVDGVHYNFSTVPEVEAAIQRGEFIEYANVHGNYYGTTHAAVKAVCDKGATCILDIDIQGVKSVQAAWPTQPAPLFIFVKPPGNGTDVLEQRLRARVRSSLLHFGLPGSSRQPPHILPPLWLTCVRVGGRMRRARRRTRRSRSVFAQHTLSSHSAIAPRGKRRLTSSS
jgi:guanylate kinase